MTCNKMLRSRVKIILISSKWSIWELRKDWGGSRTKMRLDKVLGSLWFIGSDNCPAEVVVILASTSNWRVQIWLENIWIFRFFGWNVLKKDYPSFRFNLQHFTQYPYTLPLHQILDTILSSVSQVNTVQLDYRHRCLRQLCYLEFIFF